MKIHDFTLADQVWIGPMIFKNFADQDWIGSILSDRTGLGLKNFTVHSSLLRCLSQNCWMRSHCVCEQPEALFLGLWQMVRAQALACKQTYLFHDKGL